MRSAFYGTDTLESRVTLGVFTVNHLKEVALREGSDHYGLRVCLGEQGTLLNGQAKLSGAVGLREENVVLEVSKTGRS